jgi:hypothetical protein
LSLIAHQASSREGFSTQSIMRLPAGSARKTNQENAAESTGGHFSQRASRQATGGTPFKPPKDPQLAVGEGVAVRSVLGTFACTIRRPEATVVVIIGVIIGARPVQEVGVGQSLGKVEVEVKLVTPWGS